MAPHSSTLAWKIPWMEEPDGLQSMELQRVRHDWVTSLSLFTFTHWRRKRQPTPVFLPGESQGRGTPSMGLHRVRHDWSDLAAAFSIYLPIYFLANSEISTKHWKDWCWNWSSNTFWLPDAKLRFIGKELDAGKDWREKETEQQRTRWLDSITDSMDMNLSKPCEIVEDRRA